MILLCRILFFFSMIGPYISFYFAFFREFPIKWHLLIIPILLITSPISMLLWIAYELEHWRWKKQLLKRGIIKSILVVILIIPILLPGCDAPVTVAERSDQLVDDYNALLVKKDNQLMEIERLKKANEECTGLRDEHNALINNYSNLQTQYVVLEAYSKTIRDQYTALLEQFSTRYVDSGERYTEIYKQNMILTETYRELNEQIEAVHKGNVSLLSDNLTETEYNAFYKGWRLWWGEFND